MTRVRHVSQPAAAPPGAAAFLLAEAPTIAEALRRAAEALDQAGLDTPRLDAEVLLAHALGISRPALLARLRDPLPATTRATFAGLIRRRADHEPVAYLTHHKEFYGLDFYVDQRVLIPRPETELLVEKAVEIAHSRSFGQAQDRFGISDLCLADVGTGSGCIAVALAKQLPRAEVYATDVSEEALEVARINVERHSVSNRVHLVHGDLLTDLDPDLRFDIIVANLPYVSEPELKRLPATVREYEPVARALAAGPDGLDLIRRLLAQAPHRLREGGAVLLEIGANQGAAVSELARRQFPRAEVRLWQDLAGLDRVVEVRTAEGDEVPTAGR